MRRPDLLGSISNLVVIIASWRRFSFRSARRHCSGSIRQLVQCPIVLVRFSIVRLIQTAALVRGLPYDTDSPLLTRSTYFSDHGPCAVVPVYKRPVFRQSSPKLDLILNINVLESSPSASPFPHLLHKPLRVVSSNTRDFYLFRYSPPVHLLVQVVLSRPVEALTRWPPIRHPNVSNALMAPSNPYQQMSPSRTMPPQWPQRL